jgi:hypothetical protein
LIERERMRLIADDFIKTRNAQADVDPAREYHDALLAFAAGNGR